jgi:hypothetical protein
VRSEPWHNANDFERGRAQAENLAREPSITANAIEYNEHSVQRKQAAILVEQLRIGTGPAR